jgi:hypothetical protein
LNDVVYVLNDCQTMWQVGCLVATRRTRRRTRRSRKRLVWLCPFFSNTRCKLVTKKQNSFTQPNNHNHIATALLQHKLFQLLQHVWRRCNTHVCL